MSPDAIRAAYAARRNAVEELRALDAKAEGREYTGEEKQAEERMQADITRLDERIQKGLDELEREQRSADSLERYERLMGKATGQAVEQRETDQVDKALRAFLKGEVRSFESKLDPREQKAILSPHRYESRALSTSNVPQTASFVGQLYEALVDLSSVRKLNPTVITTGSGEPLTWPRSTAEGAAQWLSEGGTLQPGDPTLSSITLNAWKLGKLITVSSEALQDEGFDLVGYLARSAARNIAIATDTEYVNGTTPATRPEGIIPNATVGQQFVTGNTTSFTTAGSVDTLFDVYHSVAPQYRTRASWLMNDALVKVVRKLKDTTNQYLWQPGLALGVPDTLLGKPVYIDPNVPGPVGASNKVAAFGDFTGYVIRDVGTVRFERSDDFAFSTDQVSFRAIWRTDGMLIDTAAIRLLQNSAT